MQQAQELAELQAAQGRLEELVELALQEALAELVVLVGLAELVPLARLGLLAAQVVRAELVLRDLLAQEALLVQLDPQEHQGRLVELAELVALAELVELEESELLLMF